MILLDTNVLSEPMRVNPDRKLLAKLSQHSGSLAASTVTLTELRFGAMIHQQPKAFWSKIENVILPLIDWIPVDKETALIAGDIRAQLQKHGQIIGLPDCLIAATALANDVVLVTRNIRHFNRISGLQTQNWFR